MNSYGSAGALSGGGGKGSVTAGIVQCRGSRPASGARHLCRFKVRPFQRDQVTDALLQFGHRSGINAALRRRRNENPPSLTHYVAVHFLLEAAGAVGYYGAMPQTLEQRVEELEKKLADLTGQSPKEKPRNAAWQRTFGLSRDDEGFEEMVRLGREYRKNLGKQDDLADS